jgi:hypothetical protein
LPAPARHCFSFDITIPKEFSVAKFATQDRLYGDPSDIAHEIVEKIIFGHEKRELTKAQYREKVEKRKQNPFGEVFKFVAEEAKQS